MALCVSKRYRQHHFIRKKPQLLKLKNSETYLLMMMAVSAAVMIATVVLTAVVFVLTVL